MAVILGIVFGVMKIKKNLKLSYEINFGNLFIKDIKDSNNDNDTNITISNSMDKNSNIQLSTLGQSKQNL